jgi:UDP-N-acetylmuramoylalanine--D-glutamate ligase
VKKVKNIKNLVILGAGESGVGAAILATKQGINVFVSDAGKIKDNYLQELQELKIEFEQNGHSEERILTADEIIKSPGIPDTAPLIIKAHQHKISVVSEIEFAYRYTNAKMICVTGSNGKTTTTLLIHHILKNAGINSELSGNIGISLARLVAKVSPEYFVNELSSFQLDNMFEFKADIAVLLNITPDHLDRYDYNIENYIQSKFRITNNQSANDKFIFCLDDELVMKEIMRRKPLAENLGFTIQKNVDQGAQLIDKQILVKYRQDQLDMSMNKLALQGKHNLYNSMAAGIVSKVLDIRNETIRESMGNFKNVDHRLEDCGMVQGVTFINDSKATNVNAAWYALESISSGMVWIVGGVDKGNDYDILKDLVKEKVRAIICLGKDNSKIKKAFGDVVSNIIETDNAMDAVKQSFYAAKKGDTVLLSPACASFDLFENYIERGNQFKAAIREL